MREYEALPGDHIISAITELIRLANLHNESVSMVFNDIEVIAEPESDSGKLHSDWIIATSRRSEAYRNSSAGKRANRVAEHQKKTVQKSADKLMQRFETLDYSDLEELIQFLDDLTDPSDYFGVSFNRFAVVDEFIKHGFLIGANTGDDFDVEDRENFARYIIGQALHCLFILGSIPKIYQTMARQWKNKFYQASSTC